MRTSCGRQCVPFESTCVCFFKAFCGKNLTPIPRQQTALRSLLFFFPPSLPHYVLFTPLEAARLSPSPPSSPTLSTLLQASSDLAAACVPTSYRCVYHPCVCLNSPPRELALFGEAKENSNVEDTPRRQPRWITALSHGTKGCHTFKM